MKITSIKHIAIALLAFVFSIGSASAAVFSVPDWTGSSGGNDNSIKETFDRTNNYYISGKITFTTIDTNDAAFSVFSLDDGPVYKSVIGKMSYEAAFAYRYNTVNSLITRAAGDLASGDVIDFVLKVDGSNSSHTFWLNPDRTKIESNQGSAEITNNMNPFHYGHVNGIYFKTGRPSGTFIGETSFENFAVYTGTDTPFAVPEPETYALIFGGLALGFVMLRRRFKA